MSAVDTRQNVDKYLWSDYTPDKATFADILSLISDVNEMARERFPIWHIFTENPDHFEAFFRQVLELSLEKLSFSHLTCIVSFVSNCFNSLEVELVRSQVQRLVSLSIWSSLSEGRRKCELSRVARWRKCWKTLQKRDAQMQESEQQKLAFYRNYLKCFIDKFLTILHTTSTTKHIDKERLSFLEHSLQFLIDIESFLPTRRFFNVLLDDCHVIVRCQMSSVAHHDQGKLFSELLDILKFYARFEIDDESGDSLSDSTITAAHYDRINNLQMTVFSRYPCMRDFSLSNVAAVDTREQLLTHFQQLNRQQLQSLLYHLSMLPSDSLTEELSSKHSDFSYSMDFFRELLVYKYERHQSQLVSINRLPLYPSENCIWDLNLVPDEYFSGEECLALPKLNLQFLTLHDYLLRNFNLFRLETTYEIRKDIEDVVPRLKAWLSESGDVLFSGWARMAHPISAFNIVEVAKPRIGESVPSRVRADVSVVLSVRADIKQEWESLRRHDVCFLITLVSACSKDADTPHKRLGIKYIRGCEIEGMLDSNGRVIEEGVEPRPELAGDQRTYRIWLDCNQYQQDMHLATSGAQDVYETFNVLMRRKPKENNFKAVLETIRDLMNSRFDVPDWLHDILLGYGDPASAHYSRMPNYLSTTDWNDTFIDRQHLIDSFPDHTIQFTASDDQHVEDLVPPFRLTFQCDNKDSDAQADVEDPSKIIHAESYEKSTVGPYLSQFKKINKIRFTPVQIEAIRSGMQPGLTLIVGPPGTGKTDVAVQIVSNLYHNNSQERTLIITHSNQALNQLFEKISCLDVDELHLLRLGHGEKELQTEQDFSRRGRVDYLLRRRIGLLEQISRLRKSVLVTQSDERHAECVGEEDVTYSCESAALFNLQHVKTRWNTFLNTVSKKMAAGTCSIKDIFPFTKFFEDAPQPLFKDESVDEDLQTANSCYRYISQIFAELEELRAFEFLRTGAERGRYLLVKHARVVAMTCTHAAMKRSELIQLCFRYDNVLMEEAGQILEVETFIPLFLQQAVNGQSRLKRWIMIGDHNQLPPIIKNSAFQKYSNMEQSLFTRFVRLGVPYVELDAQGRARHSLISLFSWRYRRLTSLPHVLESREYSLANAGFLHEHQLIDVSDYNGVGESCPQPYFYQNLAEAEYIVGVYMYMRLLGYPSSSITILSTYNGQKHLIRDIVQRRCSNNPFFGAPFKVDTVDKYQGQQNDYILLSLVRTARVGHIRDVRRLVVALSRARLGLYVFARVSLFSHCVELREALTQLTVDGSRGSELALVTAETHAHCTRQCGVVPPAPSHYVVRGPAQMHQLVEHMYLAAQSSADVSMTSEDEVAKAVTDVSQ